VAINDHGSGCTDNDKKENIIGERVTSSSIILYLIVNGRSYT